MAQQSTKKEYNTFVKGLITEAGPLTFPENASLDEANCVLNRDGSRQRRLGMDFENDFVLRNVTVLSDDAIASFRWNNAANDVDNQLAVVQAGQKLFVFDATATSISASLLATLDLSAYITGKTVISTDSGMGYFFVAEGKSSVVYLSFNPTTLAITVTPITINIRDQFGVNDTLAVDAQPNTLSAAHNYNLLNQGWNATNIAAYVADPGAVYPANSQQWFVGKDSSDVFQAALLKKQDFGTTPAPKGRYIIDAFARSTSRNSQSGLATAADIELGYPSVVGFAFERVFYAGCHSTNSTASQYNPNYTGFVFYSRTLRSAKDFGQCHSDADPTSEHDSELVETDGGFVNIPESGPIYKLIQKEGAMLVFAAKGVWAITGGDSGFTGTTHQVKKITSFGVNSATPIVDAETAVVYWNRGGIYVLGPDDNGMPSAKNVTEESIQTYFNTLTKETKYNAVGAFDNVNRRLSWMFNDSDDYTGNTFRNKYNKELVYDFVLSAWYINTISPIGEPSPYIAGYLETPDFLLREEGIRTRGESVTKYLTVQFIDPTTNAASISFSYYRDPTFRDWKSADNVGVAYESYLITGYEVMGDSARAKQTPYFTIHFKQTERNSVDDGTGQPTADNPSGCIVQAQWDWANHADSGKWGQEFQAYRMLRPYILPAIGQPITYGQEVITTKNRLPGSGKALSLYIRSDGDKDFYIYGWAINFTGKSDV